MSQGGEISQNKQKDMAFFLYKDKIVSRTKPNPSFWLVGNCASSNMYSFPQQLIYRDLYGRHVIKKKKKSVTVLSDKRSMMRDAREKLVYIILLLFIIGGNYKQISSIKYLGVK